MQTFSAGGVCIHPLLAGKAKSRTRGLGGLCTATHHGIGMQAQHCGSQQVGDLAKGGPGGGCVCRIRGLFARQHGGRFMWKTAESSRHWGLAVTGMRGAAQAYRPKKIT